MANSVKELSKTDFQKLKDLGYKGPNNLLLVAQWFRTDRSMYLSITPAKELVNNKPYFVKTITYQNQQLDKDGEAVGPLMFVTSKATLPDEQCRVTADYNEALTYCIRVGIWALEP